MIAKEFSDCWPEGVEALQAFLLSKGFQDLEVELSGEGKWPYSVSQFLAHYHYNEKKTAMTWALLGKEKKHPWPQAVQLIVAHKARKSDVPEKLSAHVLWTEFPEALVDVIFQELAEDAWMATEDNVLSAKELSARGVSVEGHVLISRSADLAVGVEVLDGVRIGPRVKIGQGSRLLKGATVHSDTVIGDYCTIGEYNVLGAPGFGVIEYPSKPSKRRRCHVGRVTIGDRVSFGSHVCVDRAVFAETRIGNDVLVDNHVQVAHNCIVEEGTQLCAFVGLAGSSHVGKGCILAGAVGVAGHLKIGDGAILGGQTGVNSDLAGGKFYKGYPPLPIQEALRVENLKIRLPELYRRLKEVEKKLT